MKFINRFTILATPVVLLTMILALSWWYAYGTQDTMTATVTKTERVCDGGQDGTCRWIVMTDKMSFENTDSTFHWKHDSTDLQGKLVEGETYTIEYYGWRIPMMSAYPNIIEVTQ